MTCDATGNASPADLWKEAKDLMRRLIGVCGGPCALIAEVWLSLKERRQIAFWLTPVEALVRRLLVVEAARIARTLRPANAGSRRPPRRPAARPPFCRVPSQNPEDSTAWSVRFSVLPSPARPAGILPDRLLPRIRDLETHADVLAPARLSLSAAQHRLDREENTEGRFSSVGVAKRPRAVRAAGSPWPLALRIEAVRRVLENPAPYATRLARRLGKDAARIAIACRPPVPPEPGHEPRHGEEFIRLASGHALSALAPFDSS